jgi:hypothetical protein
MSLLDSLLEADLVTPPLANGTPFFQRERRETAPKENWRHKPRKCYLLCYDPNTSLRRTQNSAERKLAAQAAQMLFVML